MAPVASFSQIQATINDLCHLQRRAVPSSDQNAGGHDKHRYRT